MPPALSVIGPNVSIARMYAAVPSMPIVATAVPKRPPSGIGVASPIMYDERIAIEITITGMSAHSRPTAMPEMMFVAGPVIDAFAISRTGRYWYSV